MIPYSYANPKTQRRENANRAAEAANHFVIRNLLQPQELERKVVEKPGIANLSRKSSTPRAQNVQMKSLVTVPKTPRYAVWYRGVIT
jgi:uncharacterized membrane-anchored protein YjiN (DUF445 family)